MRDWNSLLGLLLLTLTLAGCADYQWQKHGATQDGFSRDVHQCSQQAAQIYPTALVTQQIAAGYTAPARTYCTGTENAYGTGNYAFGNFSMNCIRIPGQQIAPITTMVDANAGNRGQAAKSCMFGKGYQLVRFR